MNSFHLRDYCSTLGYLHTIPERSTCGPHESQFAAAKDGMAIYSSEERVPSARYCGTGKSYSPRLIRHHQFACSFLKIFFMAGI
jgi:hypothetical protein